MKQEEVILLIEKSGESVNKIEKDLGMSSGTLAKAKSGVRELPSKWDDLLRKYCDVANIGADGEVKNIAEGVAPLVTTQVADKIVAVLEESKKPVKKGKVVIDGDEADKVNRLIMEKINKDFGPGTVRMLGDHPEMKIDVVPTGFLGLNEAIGIGGMPRGRIVEIYGKESCGKSLISLHVILEAQKMGLKCALVDAEHSFNYTYAKKIGVDVDKLLLNQPEFGEQGLEVADRYIVGGSVGVVVVDSVAALVPRAELEGEMGDAKMALQARLMSQACRKLAGSVSRTNTLLIFINQIRKNIGNTWGPTDITSGGEALKFYASVRLEVSRVGYIKDGDTITGNRVRVKVVKNKVAAPFQFCEFELIYKDGVNKIGELVDMALSHGVIKKLGSWFSYMDVNIGQGRDTVIELLRDNPAMAVEIESKLLNN